ncbi:MAG: aldehyde ferredoxin oxidoreductase family protein [Desulfohalobiaceae bacterium]
MYGWHGKILWIDLSEGKSSTLTLPEEVYLAHIGGKGLAGYLLKDTMSLGWDDPDMPLVLMTGPLVGTRAPTSGRMCVMSRSPLTGTVADSSVGGGFGSILKKAGWDGVVITGQSREPCGIELRDSECSLSPAGTLQGMGVSQVRERLDGRGSSMIVGPAAENRVRFANIVVDSHFFAGRNGLGLVCAAKNLKYITVQGEGKTQVWDPEGLKQAAEDINRLVAASPVLSGELGLNSYGTGALYDLMDSRRMMPADNFRHTHFPPAGQMNAHAFFREYSPKKAGCTGCRIQCKHRSRDKRPMPEFETMSHFSALIGNESRETIVEANRLCTEYGLDTISTGATLSCYSEVTGRELTPEEILGLIQDIADCRGEGAQLARGSAAYAAEQGMPGTAMTVKGQELPAYDPRGAYGMALAYATSTRGGCHLRSYPIVHEILRKPVVTDRFSFAGKARIIKISEDMNAVVDSLTACKFTFLSATLEEYAKALSAVTGVEYSQQELLDIGERIYFRERMLNCSNGFTARDDDLPERFFSHKGGSFEDMEVPALDREAFLEAVGNYYRIRGLDREGLPLQEKAKELGLWA